MEESIKQIRRRVNVSKSVKGVMTFDATIEVIEPLNEHTGSHTQNDNILELHDDLVAKLESRYPTVGEEK